MSPGIECSCRLTCRTRTGSSTVGEIIFLTTSNCITCRSRRAFPYTAPFKPMRTCSKQFSLAARRRLEASRLCQLNPVQDEYQNVGVGFSRRVRQQAHGFVTKAELSSG